MDEPKKQPSHGVDLNFSVQVLQAPLGEGKHDLDAVVSLLTLSGVALRFSGHLAIFRERRLCLWLTVRRGRYRYVGPAGPLRYRLSTDPGWTGEWVLHLRNRSVLCGRLIVAVGSVYLCI